ncbi:MAG TPA: cupin domain-containing protein [Pseudonocardia sp.]|nr:cupin domain-containing protein [Pseudonocardia sp.]
MSLPEPGAVWRAHADTEQAGAARFVAPGSAVGEEFGLFEYVAAAGSPGAMPHFHRGFSESFYVLSGRLAVMSGHEWGTAGPGDFVYVPRHGVHAFRAEGDEPARFLILFVPGAPRERFFTGMAELWAREKAPTPEEIDAFALECDQVNLRDWRGYPG